MHSGAGAAGCVVQPARRSGSYPLIRPCMLPPNRPARLLVLCHLISLAPTCIHADLADEIELCILPIESTHDAAREGWGSTTCHVDPCFPQLETWSRIGDAQALSLSCPASIEYETKHAAAA